MDNLPTHDLDAEEAVLGSCLIDPQAMKGAASILVPLMFYREKYQWIFAACLKLYNNHKADTDMPVNQVTVIYELRHSKYSKAFGDDQILAAFISECIRLTPTTIAIKHFCQIVKVCYEQRQTQAGIKKPVSPLRHISRIEL